MPDERNSAEDPRCSLEAQAHELRRRCEAISRFQGGHTYFEEELGIFRSWAEESGCLLDLPPVELSRTPDFEANEHQVWFQTESNCYFKATWPGFFGKRVVHAPDDSPDSSPIEYLERWHLHNELFGDSIQFIGAWDSPPGMRLLISQPAIAGQPASDEQIRQFFETSGWQPFQIGLDLAYFDPDLEIAISDTHPGNLVLMDDGTLAPIDLRVQKLTPNLVDAVRRLVAQY